LSHNPLVEITSYGGSCLRLKGREGVVAADAFAALVGATGRGLTADIVTYSHPDRQAALGLDGRQPHQRGDGVKVPTSLASAFLIDGPGEYEVHGVLINGVRTFRDESKGSERGVNTCFVYELDGLRAIHLGDIGHLLNEEALGEIGAVDVVCVPLGGALSATHAAELVAQLEAHLIVPMSANGNFAGELDRFQHEMGVSAADPVARLAVTISSLPQETTVVVLEPRARA
jgi:L-ascorbate metabolism protein UlaG (beta-lactamase superfamily)